MKDILLDLGNLEIQVFNTTYTKRPSPAKAVLGQSGVLPIYQTGENDPACNPNATQTNSCQDPNNPSCAGDCETGASCGVSCGVGTDTMSHGWSGPCSPCDTEQCTTIETGYCGSQQCC